MNLFYRTFTFIKVWCGIIVHTSNLFYKLIVWYDEFYSIQIRARSSLLLIIQLHQDLKILDDGNDMRAGSLSGTIFVNKWSDLKILNRWHENKDLEFLEDVTVSYWLIVSYTWIVTVLANVLYAWIDTNVMTWWIVPYTWIVMYA